MVAGSDLLPSEEFFLHKEVQQIFYFFFLAKMGAGGSAIKEVDNKEWVRTNASYLDVKDPQQVFGYVRVAHPLCGCARVEFPELRGNEPAEELAQFADAVTVACVDHLPLTDSFPGKMNHTGVGNTAYIGLHSTDAMAKQHSLKMLQAWRASMLTSGPLAPVSFPAGPFDLSR